MKKIMIFVMCIFIFSSLGFSVSNPVVLNGKTYYKVSSTDPTEDSGAEVCTKLGQVCVGYTDTSSSACQSFNPGASVLTSLSGDKSGVYCDGAPQSGVCSSNTNTCVVCPTCSVSVQCSQEIGGLYREMYVECAAASSTLACSISLNANNVADFFNQIPSLNAQLQGCPQTLPSKSGFVLVNGDTAVDVKMNSGSTQSFTITIASGVVTGIKSGKGACKQMITVSENDFNTALSSTSFGNAAAYLLSNGKIKVSGCSFLSSTRLFFVNPIVKFFAGRSSPTLPPAKPAPNCGYVGEQCNNRGCFSGICGAAKEQNSYGQWGYWNYQCLDQKDWASKCQGYGNSPAPWSCLTGVCR